MEDRKCLLFVIIIVFITLCCNNTQRLHNNKEVLAEQLWNGRKEYFVRHGEDTSQCSCVLIPVHSKGIRIEFYTLPFNKYFLHNRNVTPNDTTATEVVMNHYQKRFRYPNDKELMDEIGLCLSSASKDFNLNKLLSFSFRLSDWNNIAVQASKLINKDSYSITHCDIDAALQKTSLENNLNSLLKQYRIKVNRIMCQEEIILISKENYIKSCGFSNETDIPDDIIDVEVYVDFTHL